MFREQSKHDLIIRAFATGKTATEITKLFKSTVSRATVFETIKDFKTFINITRKTHERSQLIRTTSMLKRVQEKIRGNPQRSVRQMAKDELVSRKTIRNVVQFDLGMT